MAFGLYIEVEQLHWQRRTELRSGPEGRHERLPNGGERVARGVRGRRHHRPRAHLSFELQRAFHDRIGAGAPFAIAVGEKCSGHRCCAVAAVLHHPPAVQHMRSVLQAGEVDQGRHARRQRSVVRCGERIGGISGHAQAPGNTCSWCAERCPEGQVFTGGCISERNGVSARCGRLADVPLHEGVARDRVCLADDVARGARDGCWCRVAHGELVGVEIELAIVQLKQASWRQVVAADLDILLHDLGAAACERKVVEHHHARSADGLHRAVQHHRSLTCSKAGVGRVVGEVACERDGAVVVQRTGGALVQHRSVHDHGRADGAGDDRAVVGEELRAHTAVEHDEEKESLPHCS